MTPQPAVSLSLFLAEPFQLGSLLPPDPRSQVCSFPGPPGSPLRTWKMSQGVWPRQMHIDKDLWAGAIGPWGGILPGVSYGP